MNGGWCPPIISINFPQSHHFQHLEVAALAGQRGGPAEAGFCDCWYPQFFRFFKFCCWGPNQILRICHRHFGYPMSQKLLPTREKRLVARWFWREATSGSNSRFPNPTGLLAIWDCFKMHLEFQNPKHHYLMAITSRPIHSIILRVRYLSHITYPNKIS